MPVLCVWRPIITHADLFLISHTIQENTKTKCGVGVAHSKSALTTENAGVFPDCPRRGICGETRLTGIGVMKKMNEKTSWRAVSFIKVIFNAIGSGNNNLTDGE